MLKIRLLLTDVDGVLTDGGMYYTEDGLTMKKFNVKDGMGVILLREVAIKIGIVTADKSEIAVKRAEVLKFDFIHYGVMNKKEIVENILSENNWKPENVAFIGDDVNDIEVLKFAGLSFCPKDAVDEVKSISDFIVPIKGGKGVFRFVADELIKVQKSS